MALVLVGTSHRRAPVELRERLSFTPERGGELAATLAGTLGEAVALSTCNRTELYLVAEDTAAAAAAGRSCLADLARLAPDELAPALSTLAGDGAARHLLRVAAGLDSLVPGEAQILRQVRAAYEAARAAGATGTVLDRLFRHAFRVGKRVRAETTFGENPRSIASAAVELAEQIFGELDRKAVLVLGAGKMGELTVRSLVARGAAQVHVANRSPERAERLAGRFGGTAGRLEDVADLLAAVDVVVASTSSHGYVLAAPDVERAVRARRGRPIFFVDIAVPRDVDPAINELDGCYVYDLDDLEGVAGETIADRGGEAARAEAIVAEEAERFRAWQLSRDVVPAIASLRERAERIRAEELARAERRLGSLSPRERRAVESLTSQIVKKLLHAPTVRLKEAAAEADGEAYADALRHLFDLADGRR